MKVEQLQQQFDKHIHDYITTVIIDNNHDTNIYQAIKRDYKELKDKGQATEKQQDIIIKILHVETQVNELKRLERKLNGEKYNAFKELKALGYTEKTGTAWDL